MKVIFQNKLWVVVGDDGEGLWLKGFEEPPCRIYAPYPSEELVVDPTEGAPALPVTAVLPDRPSLPAPSFRPRVAATPTMADLAAWREELDQVRVPLAHSSRVVDDVLRFIDGFLDVRRSA